MLLLPLLQRLQAWRVRLHSLQQPLACLIPQPQQLLHQWVQVQVWLSPEQMQARMPDEEPAALLWGLVRSRWRLWLMAVWQLPLRVLGLCHWLLLLLLLLQVQVLLSELHQGPAFSGGVVSCKQ